VDLYTPVGQPTGATCVLPAALTSTSLIRFTNSSGAGTRVSPAGSLSVLDAAGLPRREHGRGDPGSVPTADGRWVVGAGNVPEAEG
jgi:hypothetical protein